MQNWKAPELKPEELKKHFTAEEIRLILSSGEVEVGGSKNFIGLSQERFSIAMERGLTIGGSTHNIFVSGFAGSEALGIVANKAREILRGLKSNFLGVECKDWIYVYNFQEPRHPRIAYLPKGAARRFKKGLNFLLDNLRKQIPVRIAEDAKIREFEISYRHFLGEEQDKLINLAKNAGLVVVFEGEHIQCRHAFKKDAENDETLKNALELSSEELSKRRREFEDAVREFIKSTASKNAASQENMDKAAVAVAQRTCKEFFDVLRRALTEEFKENVLVGVDDFLNQLETHSAENYRDFMQSDAENNAPPWAVAEPQRDKFLPWKINVFIDNFDLDGVPVTVEDNPTYERLAGAIKVRISSAGGIYQVTDHTEIQAGSLARANGGCLILNIVDFSWDALDFLLKSLRNRKIEIQDLYSFRGFGSLSNLAPEAMPINVRVIICGPTWLWHLLYSSFPLFKELFGIRADVVPELDGTTDQIAAYAHWMRSYVKRNIGKELSDGAIGRLIEYGHRLADSQAKISTDFRSIIRIIKEAASLVEEDSKHIEAKHIEKALEERFWRSNYIYERIQELIADGTILVSVSGERVGCINCLAVSDYGDIRFANPTLVTVTARPSARAGFVGIDRKVKLGGKILGKAEETIRSWIGSVFGWHAPLSFVATTSFEQSYHGIEGDSASLGEVICILSALSGKPIKQCVAITGSMNQHGEVQPIGGVNEKIEGFFDACRTVGGLSGEQGVIIPHQNIKDLMLREEVIEAVRKGRFHVWPVENIVDCAPILMNKEFGKVGETGALSQDVVEGLRVIHDKSKQFYGSGS